MGEAKRRQAKGERSPLGRKKQRQRWIMGSVLTLALIAVVFGVYWVSNPDLMSPSSLPTADNRDSFPDEHDRLGVSIGDEDAPVVVREFADYQCPACERFSGAIDRLREKYIDSGQVRFVFFDLPLRQHDNAIPAAEAARCAEDQDAWWEMHKKLFEEQRSWSTAGDPESVFTGYAESLGIDARRFGRCMRADVHLDDIKESRDLARDLGISSTPTALVDNITLTQTNWAQLNAVVKRELAAENE